MENNIFSEYSPFHARPVTLSTQAKKSSNFFITPKKVHEEDESQARVLGANRAHTQNTQIGIQVSHYRPLHSKLPCVEDTTYLVGLQSTFNKPNGYGHNKAIQMLALPVYHFTFHCYSLVDM